MHRYVLGGERHEKNLKTGFHFLVVNLVTLKKPKKLKKNKEANCH